MCLGLIDYDAYAGSCRLVHVTTAMNFLVGNKWGPTEYILFAVLFMIQALSAQKEPKEFDVKLDTAHPWQGNVRIYMDNAWQSICTLGKDWTLQNAMVICRQLGYSNAESAFVHDVNNATITNLVRRARRVTFVDCTGLEDSLKECDIRREIGQLCETHSMDAMVVCSETRTPDFSVRLNLNRKINASKGRVEVFLNDEWGTICDDGWKIAAADVICRQLGYTYATMAVVQAHFGAGIGPIHKRHVNCMGTEKTIKECVSLNMTGTGYGYCFHGEDAGVICSSAREPGDFDIRLIGSIHSYIGYVQVFYQGVWGYICNGGSTWDMREADVVCKEMGFEKALAEQAADLHQQHDYYLVDNVACVGSEPALRACSYSIARECRQKSATVVCSETRQPGGKPVYGIRLVDGSKPSEGRVEVFIRGEWGSVCDDTWDMTDAFVVCRQLGFYYALSAPKNAAFGPGEGRIELDSIECIGVEDNLVLCDHPGIGYHDCQHHEDASVICSEDPAPPIGRIVRLVSESSAAGDSYFRAGKSSLFNFNLLPVSNSGRIEVHHNNLWWRVCNHNWDDRDAKVVCRQQNYRYGVALPLQQRYGPDDEGTLLAAYVNDVGCIGSEQSLDECQMGTVQPFQCPFYRDAALYCSNNKDAVLAVVNNTGLPVRLSGGSTFREGRVEVYSDGQWWAICWQQSSGSQYHVYAWEDTAAADVVCHQLGFEHAVRVERTELLFDDTNIDFFQYSMSCVGSEVTLAHCTQKRLPYQCRPGQYATVKCRGVLGGDRQPDYDDVNVSDTLPFGYIIVTPFIACLTLIFLGSICWAIRVASRNATRPQIPEWATAMIWNRPRCRQRSGQNVHSYAAIPGSEPWAPRTSRTLPEHQNGEREQQVLSYYLRRQTFPSQPCRTPPPPSYRNVVQNLDNFPIPPRADEDCDTHGSVEELDLPSYNHVMSEYPDAREECFHMQQLSHNA